MNYPNVCTWVTAREALDFLGPFFTVAVKEGSSEIIHVDVNDDKAIRTYIFCVGDWEGGELVLPQLGIKIPIHPGQVLAVMSDTLAHCSAPLKGRRIVFTCFSDKFLMKHSDKEHREDAEHNTL